MTIHRMDHVGVVVEDLKLDAPLRRRVIDGVSAEITKQYVDGPLE